MRKIPVISTSNDVILTIKEESLKVSAYFDPVFFDDKDDFIEFLNYEMPELKIIDFSDSSIEYEKIMDVIHNDPWLHYGGIIGITETEGEKMKLEEKQDPNMLIILSKIDFQRNFERLLRIVRQNHQFLFNRIIQQQLSVQEAGTFICDNDPLDILVYCNFLTSYLYNTNRINYEGRFHLQTALMEMMFNALEHGSCGISFDEKSNWLESGKGILELINQKRNIPEVTNRKIYISYEIQKDHTKFSIRDEGNGFDWRTQLKKEIKPGTHGMGIKMTLNLVDNLTYNEKGNEVSFEIKNQINETNSVPVILKEQSIVNIDDKEIICNEKEQTNDLYFIVSGLFAIYARGKLISILTPKDIFIGEMSFLLNGKRSATVVGIGKGKLIKVKKSDFLNLIKTEPHYGVFLARLLAQRLVKQSNRNIELSYELAESRKRQDRPAISPKAGYKF